MPSELHLINVHTFIRHALVLLIHLGVFGPLFLGVLDSSFLFFPFGNDLLVVALSARDHAHVPWYVLTAAIGSCAGVFLLDLVSRKGGEEGLGKLMSKSRMEYLKKKIGQRGALAVGVASIAPPPFPFTVVIAASSALQYPRKWLLGMVLAGRAVRFTIVGLLAIWLGRRILRMARTPGFEWFMAGFIALCIAGSAYQVVRWVKRAPARKP